MKGIDRLGMHCRTLLSHRQAQFAVSALLPVFGRLDARGPCSFPPLKRPRSLRWPGLAAESPAAAKKPAVLSCRFFRPGPGGPGASSLGPLGEVACVCQKALGSCRSLSGSLLHNLHSTSATPDSCLLDRHALVRFCVWETLRKEPPQPPPAHLMRARHGRSCVR